MSGDAKPRVPLAFLMAQLVAGGMLDVPRAGTPRGKAEPVRPPAVRCGRNQACPCGSGKKFKACCRGKV